MTLKVSRFYVLGGNLVLYDESVLSRSYAIINVVYVRWVRKSDKQNTWELRALIFSFDCLDEPNLAGAPNVT